MQYRDYLNLSTQIIMAMKLARGPLHVGEDEWIQEHGLWPEVQWSVLLPVKLSWIPVNTPPKRNASTGPSGLTPWAIPKYNDVSSSNELSSMYVDERGFRVAAVKPERDLNITTYQINTNQVMNNNG